MTGTQPQTLILDLKRRNVSVWLAVCMLVVALIVVVGGLTRLTESGLSIVEWKPVEGIIPPLNDADFQAAFDAYKTSPQFKKVYPDLSLDQFRHIFWLEYIHRLLGRIAGVIFLLPLLWFAWSRSITWRKTLQLIAIFTLGGAQACIGWFMVQSGLKDDPHVSTYFLASHLFVGFSLFGLLVWQMLTFSTPRNSQLGFELPRPHWFIKLFACLVVCLVLCQVVIGASVAGQHAGYTFNTFPLMEGRWLPEGFWPQEVWYKNIFEDVPTVQFFHRVTAYGLCMLIPLFWLVGHNNPHIAHLLPILFSIMVVQFLLGVLTLLFVVPVPLASLHQANALLLFGIAVAILHRLFIPLKSIVYDIGSKQALA